PLPSVVEAIAKAATEINRYPDPGATRLTESLAERLDVPPGHVALGAGSVAAAAQILAAGAAAGVVVLSASRSFDAYPLLADLAGATSVTVPLRDETHDLEAMADAVTPRTRLIFVCNPNNPTGTVCRKAEIERFLDRVPEDVLVV